MLLFSAFLLTSSSSFLFRARDRSVYDCANISREREEERKLQKIVCLHVYARPRRGQGLSKNKLMYCAYASFFIFRISISSLSRRRRRGYIADVRSRLSKPRQLQTHFIVVGRVCVITSIFDNCRLIELLLGEIVPDILDGGQLVESKVLIP